MDIRAQAAREHHRSVATQVRGAAQHRQLRNRLICQLRAEDPQHWSYKRLAAAVGCSPELIAAVVRAGGMGIVQ